MQEASERFIVPRFKNLLSQEVRDKGKGQGLVTDADLETEVFLSDALCKVDADSCFIGEEAVAEDSAILKRLEDDDPVWIIDPVDGTRNFANGNENFCIMIAKVQSNTILQSWIYMPSTGECLIAEAGQGAYLYDRDGLEVRKLRTKEWAGLDASFGRLSFGYFGDAQRRLIRERADRTLSYRRSIGSAGCEYANVAKGNLDYAMFYRLNVWDHAAGTLIVREAGGDCRLLTGQPYEPSDFQNGNLVGASTEMNEALLRLLLDPVLDKRSPNEREFV